MNVSEHLAEVKERRVCFNFSTIEISDILNKHPFK